jgi:hypothetical protein
MSKGTRSARAKPSRSPSASPSPAFWFGFDVSALQLALVRVVLFSLLSLDAFLQIVHAPRYGAGFNVGQLPLLGGLAPGRVGMTVAELVLTYAFALIAFGVAPRLLVAVSAAIYAWLYLSSQLDSYQHHYLVALVLVLASAVPWQRPAGPRRDARVASWALRLILVQLGIMYGWAAIAKLHVHWLDGTALGEQLRVPWMRSAIEALPGGWATASVLVLAAELFFAIAAWCRPLWPVAAPLAIAFHLGIDRSGLEIGLFSYVMVALWLLAIPERWLRPVLAPIGDRLDRLGAARVRSDIVSWLGLGVALAVSVAAGVAIASAVPLPGAVPVAGALGAVMVAAAIAQRRTARSDTVGRRLGIAVAHTAAIALWLAFHHATSVAVDYHRFWGGSARRLNRVDESRAAYAALLAIDPDNAGARFQLGRLADRAGQDDEALAHYRAAQHLEPGRARAFVGEAGVLMRRGQRDQALERARAALAAEPTSAEARRLVEALAAGAAGVPGSRGPDTGDDP